MKITFSKTVLAGIVGCMLACVCGGASAPFEMRTVVRADGVWEMAQATAPNDWMPAKVPGTVLGALVANKKVPDPYWGLNNQLEGKLIPDLSQNRDFYTATFRTTVKLPGESVTSAIEAPSDKGRIVYTVKGWNTPEAGK